MERKTGNMLNPALFICLLICILIFPSEGFERVVTEQEATTLRPSRLIVQIITEPESLIRLFDGLDLSFQMLRHWGRTGTALLRLPFNKDIIAPGYDYAGLDAWKRPYYRRMPTLYSAEAPRYVRISHRRQDVWEIPRMDYLNQQWF